MADYRVNSQSPTAGFPSSGVKGSPYSSPQAKAAGRVNVNAISNGDQHHHHHHRNRNNHSKAGANGHSDSDSPAGSSSKSQLKGGKNKADLFNKDNPDDDDGDDDEVTAVVLANHRDDLASGDSTRNSIDGQTTTSKEELLLINRNSNSNSNEREQRAANGKHGTGGRAAQHDDDLQSAGGDGDAGRKNKTNNNNNKVVTISPTIKENTPLASTSGSRANTPRGQGEGSKKIVVVGFDNSEKNTTRQSLGSSTDQVAEERPKFGAWQEPNLDRQRRLIERLAPYRPPAPPDPRFNTWINHFEYYQKIGVDAKQTRKRLEDSLRSNNYKTYDYSGEGEGDDVNGLATKSTSSFYTGYPQNHHRNRLLADRPRTTPGRVRMRSSGGEERDNYNNNNGMDSARKTPRTDRMTKSSTGDRDTQMTSTRRAERSRSDGQLMEPMPMIPGLDRRYMGLQSVREEELRGIVGRLTRMTSAYHAKFAPNPHVWCDNSPGAHMVMKRENTIA